MDRLTSKQLKQLLEFLREGYACLDQEAFVTHLLDGVQILIPSEATIYAEIDLKSDRLRNRTRVTPTDARVPGDMEAFETHLDKHPIATHYQRTGDGRAVKVSDFLTRRQFHATGLYNEFFRLVKMEDQMVVHLAARPAFLIAIGLNRSRRTFSERERLLLNLLRPHLAQAHANVQAITAMRQQISLARLAVEASGHGVVGLTKEGRVQWLSPRARDWLTAYFGPIRAERLPEALQAWVSHQEAVLDRADDVPPPREPLRVPRDGTCLLVRHLCEADHCLLLLEERRTVNQPFSFANGGLTRREAEVLQWVTQGKTNAEIGCILDMSTRTVQKHLEHVYEKLGVETRTAAATLALGWRSDG